jgi:hypothetical protein
LHANVAGLLLARGAVRRRELAIRTALVPAGSSSSGNCWPRACCWRLAARPPVAFARLSVAGLARIFPAAENLGGIGVDVRVLAFAVLAAVVTAVLFGLAPALQFTRASVTDAIKAGGRAAHGGAVRLHTRKVLVVGQVALAAVLSVGAGLLMRSLLEVLKTDPGFPPERIVTAPIIPPDRKDADLAHNSRLLREVAERFAAVPDVEAAGATSNLPFGNPESWAAFYRDDRPIPAAGKLPNGMQAVVTPGYFRAMGIPLLKGRLFQASDGRMRTLKRDFPSILAYLRSADIVAVINDTMAQLLARTEDPIGKAFYYGPPSLKGSPREDRRRGGNARQLSLDEPVQPQYFFSAEQFPILEAQARRSDHSRRGALAPVIRSIVAERQLDAVDQWKTMQTLIDRSVAGRQDNVMLWLVLRHRPAAGVHRTVRDDGVHRDAAHARDRAANGVGRRSRGRSRHGGEGGAALGGGGSGHRFCRGVGRRASCQHAIWRPPRMLSPHRFGLLLVIIVPRPAIFPPGAPAGWTRSRRCVRNKRRSSPRSTGSVGSKPAMAFPAARKRLALPAGHGLCQQWLDKQAVHVGEAETAALKFVSQLGVVETEQVQNGGVEIVNMNTIPDHVEAQIVGLSHHQAGFDAAAGQPHGEGIRVVIAAVIAPLNHRGAAEFPAPDHQSVFE